MDRDFGPGLCRTARLAEIRKQCALAEKEKRFYFQPYLDQTLLRVPDLDVPNSDSHAWICEAKPYGFHVLAGLIPGEQGQFVPDATVERTVRIPNEFLEECRRIQMTPAQVLEGFIADVVGLQNYLECPREDGFSSNGSDERDLASAWLDRAYGMNAIDIDALDEAQAQQEEVGIERQDFGMLLTDFEAYGGNKDELRTMVEARVEAQRVKANAAELLDLNE